MGKRIDYTQRVRVPLGPVEIVIMRNEIEQACAQIDADVAHEIGACLRELPVLADLQLCEPGFYEAAIMGMTIAWEGGRRYGLVEAMSQITDAIEKTGPELEAAADPASLEVPVIGWIGGGAEVHFDHPERLKKPVRGVFYISDLPEAQAENLARATVAQVLSFHRHSRGTAATGPVAVPCEFADATDEWRAQQAAMKRQAVADFTREAPPTGMEWEPGLSAFQSALRKSASAEPANSDEAQA